MANSAFSEPLNFGGSKLVENQKYEVELTDITKANKVVAYNSAFKGIKGVIGKEYDALTPENKTLVDNTAAEFWPLREGETEAREKPKFVNRINFQFLEPKTAIKFLYDAQFDMSTDNYPSKKLRDFVERSTGNKILGDEGFTWGDLFKKGDKFIGPVIKDGNFYRLDVNNLMKSELAGPVIKNDASALSENAQKLVAYIKANLIGQKFQSIVDTFPGGAGGSIGAAGVSQTYTDTQKAWTEIRTSGMVYSTDGKTFGFSE